jgi:beta-lactamase regulating signal transducer with metallopeptidase domain
MNTLHTIFDWLLAASLRASLLTLLVFVVQWVLQRHLSPRWRYALWLPVLIVLIAPVLPESRWSIESVFQSEPQPVEVHSAPLIADIAPVSLPSTAPPVVSVPAPVDWNQVQFLTWALGASLLLLIGGASFLRTLLRFRQSRESVSDDLLSQLEAISREVGLRHSPQVLVAPAIQSPAVTGLLRATLLLPAGFERDFTAEEARLILQHELTHLKRHDLPLNTLLCVLMALHWFNPLLWLAFFKARADREAACDAQVLVNATPQRRSEYGHALLKVEAAFAPLRLSLGFVGMLQRGATLRARIRSIAQPSRTRPLTGLLVTLCITCMTFLGVTRAEKPATATNDDTTLIALEVKTVRFQQDTTWDFGGRFKQIDPTDASKAGGQIEMLSEQGFRELQDQLQKLAGVEMGAYPRMVTQDGKEVVIRSVVNQPVPGGKDSNGKDLIADLPIGFVGKFTPKAMQDGKVALNIEITDSNLLTHNAQPVAASRVYSTPLELEPGITVAQYAWQGHGWKDGKPKSYRPTITFITAHVLDPQKGGLPADASKDFAIGHSSFLPGDSIRITQVQRTDGFMTITAEYELASADAASISLYITSTKDNGRTKTDPNQRKAITKGKGRVILHLPDVREGMPHVSFYPSGGGKSFGGIYFGTQAEADASRRMSASRAAPAVSTASGATKSPDTGSDITLNFPDDPVETVIAVYAKLKGQKVSVEPAAKGNRVKIFAPKPLSPEDAIAFIEASFLLNGFVFVADGPDNLTIRKTDTPQPSVIETKLRNIILPRVQFSGASIEEAIEYLRVKSREFDTLDKTGVQIILRPGGTKPGRISLDLTNVPLIEALRYCTELAGLTYKVEPYAVTIGAATAEAPTKLEITAKGDAKTTVTTQANKIILPSVEFRDATLVEAIEFIRAKSREHDPDKKGVNILLKGDGGTVKITLSLIDVPVPEALHYCAELSNYKLSADENSFVLTPAPPKTGANTSQLKPSDDWAPGANTEAQEKAAELRRAKPQQYDFAKAVLGDVIRFLATDAGIRFFSLPEDHPTSQRLITFSLRSSPFEVLETICRANGVVLVLDQNVWYARTADDAALVRKSYALPKTPASAETILSDIRTLLNVPATNTGTSTQGAKKAGPEVTFKEAENSVHVVATRLQHMWVDGYFKGLGGNR